MMQKRVFQTAITLLLAFFLAGGSWSSAISAPSPSAIPLIYIVDVKCDESVKISTDYFPANLDFAVLMNYYGTLGVGGTQVATVNSGGGGALAWTFDIPAFLKGSQRIAIRLENTATGYYSYNWFWNTCGSAAPVPDPGSGVTPITGIPTFNITSVETDSKVSIRTYDFPANDKFQVLMNYYGTLGVAGLLITEVDSGAGGTLDFTFSIPDSLKGLDRIAIRLQSVKSPYYAYNWFWNNTTGGTSPTPVPTTAPGTPVVSLPPGVIPTIFIQAVAQDSTVTVVTNNFPANDTFDVYMNYYGTAGIGGTYVTTVNSGGGGALTFTFDIPASMKGQTRIAIRLQSSASGYFSYNWFWNSTYP
ncbi:MAG: hypothetical protein JW987_01785 [Anaerolineaceae bacterium]|nr:hypothetical protein [Anaerolineaceae bacterium]